MTGQEALNIAQGFHKAIPITGLIMTKIDGDARGGAAISIREVTGSPLSSWGQARVWMPLKFLTPRGFLRAF